MSKKFKTRSAKYRSAIFAAMAVATSFAMFAGACSQPPADSGEEDTDTSTRVDEQVLKNGNFEFFEDNDGTYVIGTPDNWSSGTATGATASHSKSGVIGTDGASWSELTDPELPQKLWDNAELETDDENYVNYSADPEDLPFRDPASAIVKAEEDDEEDYIAEGAEYIANPHTHDYRWDGDKLYGADGNEITYYEDEDGKLYTSADFAEGTEIESNVLMIHNYVDDDKQGSATYYNSSTTLTLEANTAAKISVWVKTSDLYFGGNNDERTEALFDRGAYIELEQSVGGTEIDVFRIENINTDVLNPYNETDGTWAEGNNGWVEYTLYVSACDFAETTISLTVGLGQSGAGKTEGYAFFDDITYEKYLNADDMIEAAGGSDTFESRVAGEKNTTCTLLDEDGDKVFRVDREIFDQSDKPVENYSNYRYYYVDLATSVSDTMDGIRIPVQLDETNLAAGLTVDEDGYVSSRGNGAATIYGKVGEPEGENTYLNKDLNLDVSEDVIANLSIGAGWTWPTDLTSKYSGMLEDELKTAADLPGTGGQANTLLMLSAWGAAYEAVISDPSFTFDGESDYKIVSFWIKTSELGDGAALTVTARQKGNEENAGSFQADSTTVEGVTINDTEDVYNGWIQCFALVSCEEELEDQAFELVINYGPTTIKDTAKADYTGGWAAVSNISVLNADETAFGFTESAARAAELSITEESDETESLDDPADNKKIETEIAQPSSYTGVNGASSSVQSVPVEPTEYDEKNGHDYAGLINKEYFDAYKATYAELLTSVDAGSPLHALFGADATWDTAVGPTSTQPLLIVNTVREIAGKTAAIYNYGFFGGNSTISANGYTAVSVRVKVSAGAVATVYLVDSDPDSKQPLSFRTPAYTFWYDNDGNVLKGEPDEDWTREQQRANIAYTLRDDGLYEDSDGNLYANLYNLEREYYDERADYYDADGNSVAFDNVKEGEIYYADAARTAYASHYLVTDGGDRVYSYVSGLDGQVTYNYFVDGQPDSGKQVKAFDLEVAVPRYTAQESAPYSFTIDAITNPELAGKWITVNFFIRTGSADKAYRLELWSGTRDGETHAGVQEGSYVMFDQSSVTLDESTFNSLLSLYSGNIIDAYRDALRAADSEIVFESNDENIAYYEALAADKKVSVDMYDYSAQYYTYSLYDSASYVPFNGETAEEGDSGYNYAYGDYTEQLAVLKVNDMYRADGTELNGAPMLNMFIDYTATDKSISMSTTPDATEDETTDAGNSGDTNVWLLASSIIMVVAILIAIAVLLLRDLKKKVGKKPQVSKNTYNYKKNKRYVRTYVKEHGETTISDETNGETGALPETGEGLPESGPAEEQQTEQSEAGQPADEQPSADNAVDGDEAGQPAEEQSSSQSESGDEDKNN